MCFSAENIIFAAKMKGMRNIKSKHGNSHGGRANLPPSLSLRSSNYEYAYDGCGSMTYDDNKGITKIDYDLLGNPKKISFADRSYIEYVYYADGRRLRTRHFTAVPSSATLSLGQASTLTSSQIQSVDSSDYIGDFVFENNAFKQYHFFGGYITSSGLPTNYKYYVKDHLGSVRAEYSSSGVLNQRNNYYAYGGDLGKNNIAIVDCQTHKYNGKEFDTMHGLNLYDSQARQYDATIGMFTSMDPLCEKYYHISPYVYCGGNPVNRVDPDGRLIKVIGDDEFLDKYNQEFGTNIRITKYENSYK